MHLQQFFIISTQKRQLFIFLFYLFSMKKHPYSALSSILFSEIKPFFNLNNQR